MDYPRRPVFGDPLMDRLMADRWRSATAIAGGALILPPLLVLAVSTPLVAISPLPAWFLLAHIVLCTIPVVWVIVWFGGPGSWPPERWLAGGRAIFAQAAVLLVEAVVIAVTSGSGGPGPEPLDAILPVCGAVLVVLFAGFPAVMTCIAVAGRLTGVRALERVNSADPLDLYGDPLPGSDHPGTAQFTVTTDALVWRFTRRTRWMINPVALGADVVGRVPLHDITGVHVVRVPDAAPPYAWFTLPGGTPVWATGKDALVIGARGTRDPIRVPSHQPEVDAEVIRRRMRRYARTPPAPGSLIR